MGGGGGGGGYLLQRQHHETQRSHMCRIPLVQMEDMRSF